LQQFLAAAPNSHPALILGAYLDERKKWENKLEILAFDKTLIIERLNEIKFDVAEETGFNNKIKEKVSKDNKIKVFILNLFGLKTSLQKKLNISNDRLKRFEIELKRIREDFVNISKEYVKTIDNPPKAEQYELAMIGNSLFKSR
jgi:hypothetical protein